eukprot:TRINITY_DN14936_c0_g1_i1.p1 TRINITY_DN14936_c0_g1~~TRINITY_DN14936_c0_g1_i1.p1  ORF type:complete len:491 (+),score=85.26 TRINITY_DN14936_c0_g1_i1:69-1541(+)
MNTNRLFSFFFTLTLILTTALVLANESLTSKPPAIQIVQTAKDSGDRLTPKPSIHFNSTFNNGIRTTLELNLSATFQTILGFGGAFTQSAAVVLSQLNETLQQQVLDAYFGPDGLQYSIGRIPMDSCDFSQGNYSYDTVDGDFELVHFNISGLPDTEYIIPLIQRAKSISNQDIKFFVSSWSPPAWMKSNGQMDHSERPFGLYNSNSSYYSTWALYYSKFISSYNDYGVDIWAITGQNEPTQDPRWEACCFTAEDQRDFIKYYLGPQISADHPNVSIMILDDQKNFLYDWAHVVLSDPVAAQYVAGAGVHWYTGDWFDVLEKTHNAFPDIFIMGTEACCGYLPWDMGPKIGDWDRGERYGIDIMGDINHWAVAWTDWNLILDMQGGPNHVGNYVDAAVLADTDNQTLYYQITFYYMGQFSKFVPRGSVRIGISKSEDLETTAFLTPSNQIVVVVMNLLDVEIPYSLVYKDNVADHLIPAHAIQTLSFPQF